MKWKPRQIGANFPPGEEVTRDQAEQSAPKNIGRVMDAHHNSRKANQEYRIQQCQKPKAKRNREKAEGEQSEQRRMVAGEGTPIAPGFRRDWEIEAEIRIAQRPWPEWEFCQHQANDRKAHQPADETGHKPFARFQKALGAAHVKPSPPQESNEEPELESVVEDGYHQPGKQRGLID